MKVGEYVILAVTPTKNALARVVYVNEDARKYKAVLEKNYSDGDTTPFEFKKREVLAYLGSSPKTGSAYGVNIELLHDRIEHPFWGEIHYYTSLDDAQRKALRIAMKGVQAKLEKMRMPTLPLTVEIREQKGKMLGYYKYKPKAEFDVLCAKVDEGITDMDYILAHEYAHGIWFRHMTPKQRMSWIRMYHDAITLNEVSSKELKSILSDIISNGDVRSYFKECDEETLHVLRAVFRHIKQVHSIDRKHFELALTVGDDVEVFWPKAIELGENAILLTDYAKKSPEELFAEAFSLEFSGKKLPQKIHDLLDRHMRHLIK